MPFLLSDTVGFIRKLPHSLVESFKSTLDEVRESDILIHVVDISHPNFEEQLEIVKQTLTEINAINKPTLLLFNKIDKYTFIEKETDDLSSITKDNYTIDDLKNIWIAKANNPCVFISALKKDNIEELRHILYSMVKKVYIKRYPYKFFEMSN